MEECLDASLASQKGPRQRGYPRSSMLAGQHFKDSPGNAMLLLPQFSQESVHFSPLGPAGYRTIPVMTTEQREWAVGLQLGEGSASGKYEGIITISKAHVQYLRVYPATVLQSIPPQLLQIILSPSSKVARPGSIFPGGISDPFLSPLASPRDCPSALLSLLLIRFPISLTSSATARDCVPTVPLSFTLAYHRRMMRSIAGTVYSLENCSH